jgi:hypothetical protein
MRAGSSTTASYTGWSLYPEARLDGVGSALAVITATVNRCKLAKHIRKNAEGGVGHHAYIKAGETNLFRMIASALFIRPTKSERRCYYCSTRGLLS